MNKYIVISGVVLLAVFFGCVGDAFSAFVVTPMEFHLDVADGEEATNTFYVKNRGEEVIALKIYTGDFWIGPDGKEKFLDPGELDRSCGKWIEVTPEEIELAPDESHAVRFKLTMPLDKRGSFWSMIFIEQITKPTIKTATQGAKQFNILSFQRVGLRIFEKTPGSEIGDARINQVDVKWLQEEESFKVSLVVENLGEVLMKCKGIVEFKDETGETIKSIEVEEFKCYPQSKRVIESVLKEKLALGQYTALAVIDYGSEYLVAGEAVFEVKGD